MVWKNFVSQLAITLRRKVLAAAIVHATSVIVHLISPVGHGTEFPTHSAQRTNPLELRVHRGFPKFSDANVRSPPLIKCGGGLPLGFTTAELHPLVNRSDCFAPKLALTGNFIRQLCSRPSPASTSVTRTLLS